MSEAHIAIGLVGYQNGYKSKLLRAFLNDDTDLMKSEKHVTLPLCIKEAQIFKCASPDATCYISRKRGHVGTEVCAHPGHESDRVVLSRDVSLLDFPDKTAYASTILGGIFLLDGVLILSDAKVTFGRLPTVELIAAASVLKKNIVLIQSMKDPIDDTRIWEHHQEITKLITGMHLDESLTILPSTSANSNIGALCTRISNMHTAEYEYHAPTEMIIIDSCIHEAQEGKTVLTIHGRVLKGVLKEKQQLEIRPGSFSHDENGQIICNPVIINVATLGSIGGNVQLEQAAAGDMIAVRSNIDYGQIGAVVANMSGFVVGHVGTLPDVLSALKLKIILLPLMFDSYMEEFKEVSIIDKGEILLVTVGMLSAAAEVRKVVDESTIVVTLKSPICARKKDKVLLLRSANVFWRLIGHRKLRMLLLSELAKLFMVNSISIMKSVSEEGP